jgi:hypothetical protein
VPFNAKIVYRNFFANVHETNGSKFVQEKNVTKSRKSFAFHKYVKEISWPPYSCLVSGLNVYFLHNLNSDAALLFFLSPSAQSFPYEFDPTLYFVSGRNLDTKVLSSVTHNKVNLLRSILSQLNSTRNGFSEGKKLTGMGDSH